MLNLHRFTLLSLRGTSSAMFRLQYLQWVGKAVNLRVQFHLAEHRRSQHTHSQGNSWEASREPWNQSNKMCTGFASPSNFPVTSWYQFTGTEHINFDKAACNWDWKLKVVLNRRIRKCGGKGRGTRQHSNTRSLLLMKKTNKFQRLDE